MHRAIQELENNDDSDDDDLPNVFVPPEDQSDNGWSDVDDDEDDDDDEEELDSFDQGTDWLDPKYHKALAGWIWGMTSKRQKGSNTAEQIDTAGKSALEKRNGETLARRLAANAPQPHNFEWIEIVYEKR
ncbi:hypothetical protein DIS24_g9369 [Lasiodiplodia hormozganensis]|uniref:Uncharacterized protein n=1 Tax=Lasiodiplodia hormozganensis TaxID=869390 RepID=A0AA39XWM9_9PEZI|nr:hypothetical protein DIS24_g9369 [Lasiodiplodia hormozganensis]